MAASISRGATRLSTSATLPATVQIVSGRSSSARTTSAAACSGDFAGARRRRRSPTIMSVRTSESRRLVKVTLSAYASRPAIRLKVSSAVFEAM